MCEIDRIAILALKVNHLDRPLGLEDRHPRFSWQLHSHERNVRQSAYQILVASSEELLRAGRGDMWDSGRVESTQSTGIQYMGRPLSSRQRSWWRVQVWDAKGMPFVSSALSDWEMGLLDENDWGAQWLAAEDRVTRLDRRVGLRWIWSGERDESRLRKFRCRFRLQVPSLGGVFFASANGWFGKIIGIWIDDIPISIGDLEQTQGQWIPLGPMCAGEHLISVAVKPVVHPVFASEVVRADGLTFFARLDLNTGDTFRVGAGPNCKTSVADDANWYSPEYDDATWEAAQSSVVESHQPWPAEPAMYLRREFLVEQPILKARLYATALGAYEARLNGLRVGDALLTPEPSQYDKRVLYRVYDVKPLLTLGKNVLGFIVGDGWFASAEGRYEWGLPPRRLRAQLELTFVNGSRSIVATGPGWRTAESPIRVSQIRIGEVYDARMEVPGWDKAKFNDSHWMQAEIASNPACCLVAQISPPIRVKAVLKPRAVVEPKRGIFIFDFGQNFAGWCRLHVKGSRGARVELRFAELLTSSGEVDRSSNPNMGEPKRDVFILRGDVCGETFEPHFTYRGFRYVEVSGLPAAPTAESIEGVMIYSDLEVTGELRVDNPTIGAIWRATFQTQRSNFVGIPTDCPSREQRGWMEDAGSFWDSASFNMDVCAFTVRQMENVVDGQLADGAFPELAPWPLQFASIIAGAPGWSDGGIVLPWVAWQRYGDTSIIERNWDAMNRYMQFVLDNNPEYLWKNKRGADYGDWLALDQGVSTPHSARSTPKELIGTAYWAHSADLLAQMALAVGRREESARLFKLSQRVREAFIDAYVTDDGMVGNGSQTCYVIALKFGLVPQRLRCRAAELLAADIRKHGIALTTGFLGTQFILDVLGDMGFGDLAYSLLLRTEYPSWGYMLRQGATTLWESWSGETELENQRVKISQNHFTLGSICGFLFRRVAAIDAMAPGFETIIVRPLLDPRVKRGGGKYESVKGRISTNWRVFPGNGLELEVVLPANTIARIHLPARRESRIEEGGQDVSRRDDMQVVQRLSHEAVVEVGSGSYRFLVR